MPMANWVTFYSMYKSTDSFLLSYSILLTVSLYQSCLLCLRCHVLVLSWLADSSCLSPCSPASCVPKVETWWHLMHLSCCVSTNWVHIFNPDCQSVSQQLRKRVAVYLSSINTYHSLNSWPIYYCSHLFWFHLSSSVNSHLKVRSVNSHRTKQNSSCLLPWALLFTKYSQYLFAKYSQIFSEMNKKTLTHAWFMHLHFYTTNC